MAVPAAGPRERPQTESASFRQRFAERLRAEASAVGGRRLGLVAAAALAVCLLVAAGLATVPARIAPDDEPLTDPAPSAQLIRLLQLGGRQLAGGDPAAAAATFRRAERLSRDRARLRALRDRAEAAAAALGQEVEDELESGLPEDFGSPLAPEAELGPDAAIGDPAGGTDPPRTADAGDPAAARPQEPGSTRRSRPGAQRPDLRRSELLAGGGTSSSTGGGPAPGGRPSAGRRGAAAAVAGEAALAVELVTAKPSGSVVVAVNERRVISRNFAFFEKTSRFSRRKPTGGELSLGPAEVPAGVVELDVWVAVEGQPAELTEMTARFPPDSTRRLRVDIAGSGEVTVRLE